MVFQQPQGNRPESGIQAPRLGLRFAAVIVSATIAAGMAVAGDEPQAAAPPIPADPAAASEVKAPEAESPPVVAPAAAPGAAGVEAQGPANFPINASLWTPVIRENRRDNQSSPIQFSLPSPINAMEKEIAYPIDGSLSAGYRYRKNADGSDQDFTEVLSLRAGDPEKNKLSGEFLGRLNEDIDGRASDTQHDAFRDINDSYGSNVNGRFYLGYLNLRRYAVLDNLAIDTVRLGRQTFDETAESFTFDGGRIDTKAFEDLKGLRLTAYGGHLAHYYESSGEGDALVGAGAEIRPIHRGRARVDWTWVQDRIESTVFQNNLLSLAYWQGLGEYVTLHGRYNVADGVSRDYLLRGTFQQPAWDFLFQTSFHQVVKTLRQYTTDLDYYYEVMKEYQPYWEIDLRASKGLGDNFVVDGGAVIRQLTSQDSEGTFNHEYVRYYLTPSTRNWPIQGMSLSLTGEIWDTQGEDPIYTAGGEISQRILKVLTASFGTSYSLYRYDFLSGEERIDDRAFYWKLDYQVLKDLKLTGLYQLERDDISTYHTVEIGLRYSF